MTLDEFEQLCSAATTGPWVSGKSPQVRGKSPHIYVRYPDSFDWICSAQVSNSPNWAADAEFIAACREMAPKLIAVAKAGKRLLEVKKVLDTKRVEKSLLDRLGYTDLFDAALCDLDDL